jgi:hypothetical protein
VQRQGHLQGGSHGELCVSVQSRCPADVRTMQAVLPLERGSPWYVSHVHVAQDTAAQRQGESHMHEGYSSCVSCMFEKQLWRVSGLYAVVRALPSSNAGRRAVQRQGTCRVDPMVSSEQLLLD